MKIGYYSPGWPSKKIPNGIVKYLDILIKPINLKSHETVIFSSKVLSEKLLPNVIDLNTTIDNFKFNLFHNFLTKVGMGSSIKRGSPFIENLSFWINKVQHDPNLGLDVIEIEESFGWVKDLTCKINVPIIVKLHGPWFLNGEALGVDKNHKYDDRVKAERDGIVMAAGVTAPSQSVLDETRRYYGIELPNAKVIPNPVLPVNENNKWKLEKCIKNQILFVGRFDKHKGGDIVIKAFNIIAKKNKHAALVFAGPDRGVKVHSKLMSINEYINTNVMDKEIKKRIKYLGQVSSEKIEQLRRDSHITIMASRWENFANTVLEALAMGCPTVGTESGGTPEIIKNNITGLLSKVADPVSLADKIDILLSNDNLSIELGRNAATDMEIRYSPSKLACETLNYYNYIVALHKNNNL